jgi:hypothetical protein
MLKTTIWAQNGVSGVPARLRMASPRNRPEAMIVISAPQAGGISRAYAATRSTYSAGKPD